jgi:hypothetical protein
MPVGHGLAQPPQFIGSLVTSTQAAPQSIIGGLQLLPPSGGGGGAWQAPFIHRPLGHEFMQPPQFIGSLVRSAQY